MSIWNIFRKSPANFPLAELKRLNRTAEQNAEVDSEMKREDQLYREWLPVLWAAEKKHLAQTHDIYMGSDTRIQTDRYILEWKNDWGGIDFHGSIFRIWRDKPFDSVAPSEEIRAEVLAWIEQQPVMTVPFAPAEAAER